MRTRRISEDEARSLRRDQLRGDTLTKLVDGAPSSWNADRRSVRFTMSSERRDLYGDIVKTSGIDLQNFLANPVALLSHDASTWSIGKWARVEKILGASPARLEGDLILHESGGPIKQIDEAAWMLSKGYIRGASIGFVPNWSEIEMILEADGSWNNGGLIFHRSVLIECSICNVPANPDAMAKGLRRPATPRHRRQRDSARRQREIDLIRLRHHRV
jgi:phage head maturation protease